MAWNSALRTQCVFGVKWKFGKNKVTNSLNAVAHERNLIRFRGFFLLGQSRFASFSTLFFCCERFLSALSRLPPWIPTPNPLRKGGGFKGLRGVAHAEAKVRGLTSFWIFRLSKTKIQPQKPLKTPTPPNKKQKNSAKFNKFKKKFKNPHQKH